MDTFAAHATFSTPLRIQAIGRDAQDHQAILDCPHCGEPQTCATNDIPALTGGAAFQPHTWYPHQCSKCSQHIQFMLEFPTCEMKTGLGYQIIKPAHSFGVIDGELVNFPEEEIHILIEEKPIVVQVDDGSDILQSEPIPEHLAQPDWYWVRNLHSGKKHWLNIGGYLVTLLPQTKKACA